MTKSGVHGEIVHACGGVMSRSVCRGVWELIVGILSDSHGDHGIVARAMALFDSLAVEHLIHCGDVGGQSVFDELVGRALTFVWGNTDYPPPILCAYVESVGFDLPSAEPTRVDLDGKRFAVFHGHEFGFDDAIGTLDVDYILHGHTHCQRDDRCGAQRIINPGALHRARRKTVATLDTATDQLTFHEIAS